jgi:hypothetical protein
MFLLSVGVGFPVDMPVMLTYFEGNELMPVVRRLEIRYLYKTLIFSLSLSLFLSLLLKKLLQKNLYIVVTHIFSYCCRDFYLLLFNAVMYLIIFTALLLHVDFTYCCDMLFYIVVAYCFYILLLHQFYEIDL